MGPQLPPGFPGLELMGCKLPPMVEGCFGPIGPQLPPGFDCPGMGLVSGGAVWDMPELHIEELPRICGVQAEPPRNVVPMR